MKRKGKGRWGKRGRKKYRLNVFKIYSLYSGTVINLTIYCSVNQMVGKIPRKTDTFQRQEHVYEWQKTGMIYLSSTGCRMVLILYRDGLILPEYLIWHFYYCSCAYKLSTHTWTKRWDQSAYLHVYSYLIYRNIQQVVEYLLNKLFSKMIRNAPETHLTRTLL